jgi:hypothetical protein
MTAQGLSRTSLAVLALLAMLGGRADPQANPGGRSQPPARRPTTPRRPAGWERLRAPAGIWLGQDGHDEVGPSSAAGPSGVQDIHIALGGLPAGRGVEFGTVKGLGGGEWDINGPNGPWKAALVREAGATVADLYLEPYQAENGRPLTVLLRFDDGRSVQFDVKGGRADPNLRMPRAALRARWVGQDGHDRVGDGPCVGPDGVQDVRIALANLSPGIEVASVRVQAEGGRGWQSGVNPDGLSNAELVRRGDDPSRADLFLNPDRDLSGTTLKLVVTYTNGKADAQALTAGHCDPSLRMTAATLPVVEPIKLDIRWLGQDGTRREGRGDVHVALDGLPRGRAIVAAVLSNPARGCWAYPASGDRAPLSLRRDPDATRADLHFAPERDESGGTMTLRLEFADGRSAVARFAGGACDVGRRGPGRGPGAATARPGDDLQRLVDGHGAVKLSRGPYELDRPLILNRPVALTAEPGATLRFSQKAGDPPWSAAIKIHSGHTTLDGFAVRFATPIRWAPDTSYGPAVIGTTDNHDPGQHDLKVEVALSHLDLESPPAATDWEEAPRLIRLATAQCGRVEGNRLRGGPVEFLGGPWRIVGNESRGTPPHTFSAAVFAGHRTHDLVLWGNTDVPAGPSGKVWRFLVLTGSGAGDLVCDNAFRTVGPRDDDKVPPANAPEILLTEAYSLHFEGHPLALSADGRVLAIPSPQGEPAGTGDVVAILSGPHAGQYRRIAQAIDARTYLLEDPLPRGGYAVAIATGFVGEIFRGNTIDARGSTVAVDMFLAGNHYGTRVLDNRLLGGTALLLMAAPTEQPVHWGWSHAPSLGCVVAGNTIDSPRGAVLNVEHGAAVKSNRGRVYLSATLKDNVVRWSSGPKAALTIGAPGALDPGEILLGAEGNRAEAIDENAKPVIRVHAATVNGRAVRDRAFAMPAQVRR